MRVFISYSSKDGIDYAKTLHHILTKNGHDTYLIDHEIRASQTIWDEITKEIAARELVVFVITESSQYSRGQKQEYDFAVYKYKKHVALVREDVWKSGTIEKVYPLLFPQEGLTFSDKDLESKCETLSSQLVRLLDKERAVQETEIEGGQSFEKLSVEGLDSDEIKKCVDDLSDSYQRQTIVPNMFSLKELRLVDKDMVRIGFSYMIPREWFLPHEKMEVEYSNEFIFREFGREIALGERRYISQKIIESKGINSVEGDLSSVKSFAEILKQTSSMIKEKKLTPKVIFPTIPDYMKMMRLGSGSIIKYKDVYPSPVFSSQLLGDGTDIRLIEPLGNFPSFTIILTDNAATWHLKRYPKHGALYIDLGNDRFYPKRSVQVVAFTAFKLEADAQKIFLLKNKRKSL
jgi:hypothetical protein